MRADAVNGTIADHVACPARAIQNVALCRVSFGQQRGGRCRRSRQNQRADEGAR
jgi:hypothetical protein